MTEEIENKKNEHTRSYVLYKRSYDYRAITVNIKAIKGFQAAVAVDNDGNIVAENNPGNVDLDGLLDAMAGVIALVKNSTNELGIGRFHTGEIDGEWGHIYVNVLNNVVLLTQCDHSAHGEDVLARLERIINGCSKEA